jgi:metal-responsive CopG/Arc/MetJ family transcriptional regulator
MKTAVSIPDTIFESAERFARRLRMSRSELYAKALREYLKRHRQDSITEQLNAVYGNESCSLDSGLMHLQNHSISKDNW